MPTASSFLQFVWDAATALVANIFPATSGEGESQAASLPFLALLVGNVVTFDVVFFPGPPRGAAVWGIHVCLVVGPATLLVVTVEARGGKASTPSAWKRKKCVCCFLSRVTRALVLLGFVRT